MNLRQRLELQRQNRPIPVAQKVPIVSTKPKLDSQSFTNSLWQLVSPRVWQRTDTIFLEHWHNFEAAPWFPAWENLINDDSVAFDTETTGLSGGAGTVAFLAGTASWTFKDNRRCIEIWQVFLEDYPGEVEFLNCLLERFISAKELISYNGASFDLPLLRTRCIMNGLIQPEFAHRDMLHTARRFWKSLVPSCSLTFLENQIFGLTRLVDLPSAEIPERYLSTLGSGQGAEHQALTQIFAHHAEDMANLLILKGLITWIEGQVSQGTVVHILPALGDSHARPFYLQERLPVSARALALLQAKSGTIDPTELLLAVLDTDLNSDWTDASLAEDMSLVCRAEERHCLSLLAHLAWKKRDRAMRYRICRALWFRHGIVHEGQILHRALIRQNTNLALLHLDLTQLPPLSRD